MERKIGILSGKKRKNIVIMPPSKESEDANG